MCCCGDMVINSELNCQIIALLILRNRSWQLYLGLQSTEHLKHTLQIKRSTVFKSNTTLRSYLVGPKDALEPSKQGGVVYKIPCEYDKVYIGETGWSMRGRIKEHDRDTRFDRTQTSAVSEHANETGHIPIWSKVKFIDRDPHWYTRVKEAIHIRLHPNNINRDRGIDIPEAWIPTIKQHDSRFMRTYEGTPSNDRNSNEDRNAPMAAYQSATNSDALTIDLIA